VTVLEGRVAVEAAGNALLTAGQQVTVASTKVMTPPTRTDVDAATAWTRGKLIFDEAPLSEVIAEFNRYSARRLIVDDPELQKFHISGVFPSSDPGRVAELLRQRFGATLQQSGDEIRVVRP
jgi:transmembrane sensor